MATTRGLRRVARKRLVKAPMSGAYFVCPEGLALPGQTSPQLR